MLGNPNRYLYAVSIISILLVSGCGYLSYLSPGEIDSLTNAGTTTSSSSTTTTLIPCGAFGYGDVNLDGAVNSIDANLVLQHSAGLITLQGSPSLAVSQQDRADVSNDNSVNSIDANVILQYGAGLINTFASCQGIQCNPDGSGTTSYGVCTFLCSANIDSGCNDKRPGDPASDGGTCNNQCKKTCSSGCAGCGLRRNSDCSIVQDNSCQTSVYCGNTPDNLHSLSCEAGCTGYRVQRESDCRATPTSTSCSADIYGAQPPSGTSCSSGCASCNTFLTAQCVTIYYAFCSGYCTVPYLWPVPATTRISTCFSSGGHRGLDIDGFNLEGSNVLAISPGTVVQIQNSCSQKPGTCNGCNAGSVGNCVRLKHDDGRYSMYGHLKQATVSVGQRILKGDKVGELGQSGTATGVHLHLEVWSSDNSNALTNPCSYADISSTCSGACSTS